MAIGAVTMRCENCHHQVIIPSLGESLLQVGLVKGRIRPGYAILYLLAMFAGLGVLAHGFKLWQALFLLAVLSDIPQ